MKRTEFLETVTSYFQEILNKGMGRGCLVFPDLWKELENREETLFFESLVKIHELFNESYEFSESLSKGDLTSSVSLENVFAMPHQSITGESSSPHMANFVTQHAVIAPYSS